jgi:hypothetical protein
MAEGQPIIPEPPEEKPKKPKKVKRPKKPRRPLKQMLRLIGVRAYTIALLGGVALICAIALVYLFRSVFTPARLPEAMAQWQGSIDAASLRQPHVPGVTEAAGRAPISHFHKVDRWFQADPHNGCTVSGCHEPLPHTVKSKIAAFANLHVTFMDCAVCHEPITGPIDAHWVSTNKNTAREPPAVLRLIGLLEANGITKENAKSLMPQIAALTKETLATTGHNPLIEDLLIQIDSSVPGSPIWMKSVHRLAAEVPLHARGEYGAKLARKSPAVDAAKMAKQTKEYFSDAGRESRKQIESGIHERVLKRPNACVACHSRDSKLLDMEALGYSPKRATALRGLPLAGLMEQIRQGETFQLPRLLEGDDGR